MQPFAIENPWSEGMTTEELESLVTIARDNATRVRQGRPYVPHTILEQAHGCDCRAQLDRGAAGVLRSLANNANQRHKQFLFCGQTSAIDGTIYLNVVCVACEQRYELISCGAFS